MNLFRGNRERSPEKVMKMVETALTELNFDPIECRNDEGPDDPSTISWNFANPSTGHQIFLILNVVDDIMLLQVRCLVAKMPQDGLLPFYRRLLEMNCEELTIASFGISGQYVVLSAGRPTTELDSGEIMDMIAAVCYYVERNGAELREEFACPNWDDD